VTLERALFLLGIDPHQVLGRYKGVPLAGATADQAVTRDKPCWLIANVQQHVCVIAGVYEGDFRADQLLKRAGLAYVGRVRHEAYDQA